MESTLLPRTPSLKSLFRLYSKELKQVQWILPAVLLLGGMSFVISGFILSLNCPYCGTLQLLLGIAPCLSGGYHAYCLQSRSYLSFGEAKSQARFCVALYAASMMLSMVILRAMEA